MENTFEEKVKSMTAKEIIMAMVESLTHPPLMNVAMNSWGHVEKVAPKYWLTKMFVKPKYKCFGCAATMTVCKIANISPVELLKPTEDREIQNRGLWIAYTSIKAERISTDMHFLNQFEYAIDYLRTGHVSLYNVTAERNGFAIIKDNERFLPRLNNNYTNNDLRPYKELADAQDE